MLGKETSDGKGGKTGLRKGTKASTGLSRSFLTLFTSLSTVLPLLAFPLCNVVVSGGGLVVISKYSKTLLQRGRQVQKARLRKKTGVAIYRCFGISTREGLKFDERYLFSTFFADIHAH